MTDNNRGMGGGERERKWERGQKNVEVSDDDVKEYPEIAQMAALEETDTSSPRLRHALYRNLVPPNESLLLLPALQPKWMNLFMQWIMAWELPWQSISHYTQFGLPWFVLLLFSAMPRP